MTPRFFEETYVKYPFAPMVTFVLETADLIADLGQKARNWLREAAAGIGRHA